LQLRTSSQLFEGDMKTARAGLLWGDATCTACATANNGAAPTLDVWHRIAECTLLQDARAAALREAVARAQARPAFHHVAVALQQVADNIDSAPAREFVFLATLGATLPGGARWSFDLPPGWAACLDVPEGSKLAARRDRL